MKHLQELDVSELLEAEADVTAKAARCPFGSNVWRKWDKQLDRILQEMARRSAPEPEPEESEDYIPIVLAGVH